MIETRLLHYFLAVAEAGSITKAAETLHVSQPALSKQMRALENELGRQLLIRGNRKTSLTEDGVYLRARAREIISLLEATESTFRDKETVAGEIHAGCGEYANILPVMQSMAAFQTQHPSVTFDLFSGNADAIAEKIDKGLLDFGLLLEPDADPRFESQPLDFRESWGVLMCPECPLSGNASIQAAELAGLPLIFPSQASNNTRLMRYFRDSAVVPKIVATYNLLFNAGLMVEAGMGIAVGLGGLIDNNTNHPLLWVPFDPPLYSNVYLCTKHNRVPSRAASEFLRDLADRFTLH